MGSKIYVGNLSYDTTEETLRSLFGDEGRTVTEVALITDRDTGRPRGFGFVTMASAGEAQAAIAAIDGKEVDGRTLRVNEAQDKQRGGGGGGGRRDRGRHAY